MTKEEFIQAVKIKNPQWASIGDDDLYRQVIKRYPMYQKQIDGLPRYKETLQETIIESPEEKPGFFSRVGTALKERFGEIKKTFGETARGEISPVETGFRTVGDVVATVGDVAGAALAPQVEKLAEKEWAKPAFEALASGLDKYEDWKNSSELNRRTGEVLEGIINITDLAGGVAGGKIAGKTSAKVVKRVFDTTKAIPERIRSVRKTLPTTSKQTPASQKPTFLQKNFTENPAITGALNDIKVMVGLPDSAPSIDLTFRAVKPRLTKKINLRRVKAQMALANETITENGFKPKSIKEYADSIYKSKKKVWGKIQSQLDEGQAAGVKIDLVPTAVKILDRAEDPALLRTNRRAALQLTELAENLVKYGDEIDILEAERIKQMINAELSGVFGDMDLSKHAKEAKKMITRDIGIQLDDKLGSLDDSFRDLKIKYGALSSIEDDVLKRAIVFERQNPEGLADILTKTEAAAELVFGNAKSRARAIARLTMGKRLKEANNVDKMIERAFSKN
jgi:hypothetical protein